MAKVTVDFDGNPVSLDPKSLKDLQQASSDLQFIFGGGLASFLNQPLSSVPAKTSASLTLGPVNPSWKLLGSPATISLKAGAVFTIMIQQPNQTLFTYNPDLENSQAQKANITGKAGSCYVITKAQFNISGSLSGSPSAGAVGVSIAASGSAAYTVQNFKAFDPATALKDAVLQALAAFTLPLHEKTAANLSDCDCLYYQFDGSLNVGLGATWGVKSAQVGGTAISDIGASLKTAGNIVTTSGLAPVSVSVGANLSLKFTWTRAFECFLERRQPTAAPGGATLHICAGRTSTRGVQLGVSVDVTTIGTPTAAVDASSATQMILSKLTGQQNPPAGQAIGQQVQQAANQYIGDVNKWLAGLTQRVDTAAQKGVALSVYYWNQSQFTSAFTWHFDFANAQSAQAWNFAMEGDFLKALATGAVTLDAGSGYEQIHVRATGISLTLFGMGRFSNAQQYFDKATVSYAGNGRFQSQITAGQTVTTTSNGKVNTSSLYLSATSTGATNFNGTHLDLSDVDLRLHGMLTTKNDPKQAALIATLLADLGLALQSAGGTGGADLIRLGGIWKTAAQNGQISLEIIYEMIALRKITADDHDAGQKPPFAHDEVNWSSYALASDNLDSEPVSYFQGQIQTRGYDSYDSWRGFNCAVNQYYVNATDQTPLLNKATRVHPPTPSPLSDSTRALMRQQGYFEGTTDDQDIQLGFYFFAGQEYMNLCGNIFDLSRQIATAKITWAQLVKSLQAIAGDDLNAWFAPVVLLALAKSCNAASATIQGSALVPASGDGGVTVSLS
jgi:hypothetical protein